MKKVIGTFVALLCGSLVVLAGDGKIFSVGSDSNYFKVNSDGTIESSGAIASPTVSGVSTVTPTTANWTNGQAITVASSVYLVSGTGGANDTTNTVTLSVASTGKELRIVVDPASTNLIKIADSGNVIASGAVLLDAGDTADFYGVTTNWVQISESNN